MLQTVDNGIVANDFSESDDERVYPVIANRSQDLGFSPTCDKQTVDKPDGFKNDVDVPVRFVDYPCG